MSSSNGDRADAFGRFFLPGPTEVRPQVLAAQTRPMIGHRGSAIQEIIGRLQEGLKPLFGTQRPVFISTSSASGLMEAAVRNGARSRVLCLVNGAFSERFANIARSCGMAVDTMAVPWGDVHDPQAVAERLDEGAYDSVTAVHSETSTGALNPLDALAEAVLAQPDTLFLVDSVTGAGGVPVDADRRGLDFVLTGSQKALALPPGLSFGVASGRMMQRSADQPGKGQYFDLWEFQKQLDNLQTPTTPALSLLYALDEQLTFISSEGVDGRFARHRSMAEACWAWVSQVRAEHGIALSVLAPEGHRSPTVTCIALPDGLDGSVLVAGMRDRGFVIGGGYGKLKDTTIRIGHMGDHTVAELEKVLEALEDVVLQTSFVRREHA
jgi:predicted phosphoserine aminotransferase